MLQLLYTSAPRLLEAGKTGFGTLARSKDMPQPLVSFLERISAFDRQAGVAALQCYTIHRMGKVFFHVFSRIGDCGADYTGRTNHLAHHYVIEEGTPEGRAVMSAASPAAFMMSLSALWKTSYHEAPGYVGDVPAPSPRSGASNAWSEFTGRSDAAQWILAPQYKDGCCLLIDHIATEEACLQLLNEAMNLLPGAGWGRGFATACVNNLSVTLTPFVCLDARQTASGILPHRGYPTLNVNKHLGAPPKIAPTMATMAPAAPSPAMPMPSPPPPPINAQMLTMPTVMPAAPPSYSRRNSGQKQPSTNPLLMKFGIIGALALGGIVMYNLTSSSADKEKGTPPTNEKRIETPTPTPTQKETKPADKQDPAPSAEQPAPVAEQPAPVAEQPAPVAEQPAPVAEQPAPVAEQPAEPAAQSSKTNNGEKNTPQPSRTAQAKTRQEQTVEQPSEHVDEPHDESVEDDRNPRSASNGIQEDSLTFGQIIELPKQVCKIKVKASLGHDLSTSVKITATVDIKELINLMPALDDKVCLISNDGDKEWRDLYNFTSKQIQQTTDPSIKAAEEERNTARGTLQNAKKDLEVAVKTIADTTKKPKPNKGNTQAEKDKPVKQPATANNDTPPSNATEELKKLLFDLPDIKSVKGLKGKIDTLNVDNDLIRKLKAAKNAYADAQNGLKSAESALANTKDQYITSLEKNYEENTQLLLTILRIEGHIVTMKFEFKYDHE